MSISNNYNVIVGEYARRHFMKRFEKKYKWVWNQTFSVIENMLIRINWLLLSTKAEEIHKFENCRIIKCEFKIVWSNSSAKTWWNRIIVSVNDETNECKILLIYSKTDVDWNHETSWWEQEIINNYDEIKNYFSKETT